MEVENSYNKRGICGSTLKMIAIVSMVIDHIGAVFIEKILIQNGILEATTWESYQLFMSEYGTLYHIYEILRSIGRISFPIFCFLIVQGFLHTHDTKKYLGRMFLFALLSEIPYDLAFFNTFLDWEIQNVFFTLAFGLVAIMFIKKAEEATQNTIVYRALLASFGVAIALLAVTILRSDYDVVGVFVIVAMYVFRRWRILSAGIGCVALMEPFAFLSLLPIRLYNGQKGRNIKWLFYLFYPVHLLLFYILCLVFKLS